MTMFACRMCDKTYRLRGSLTRHLRNHSVDSSQHVCLVCDVAFSRRDLLRRHHQIHQSENVPIPPNARTEVTGSAPRRRCHTACQRCREARIKCDGEHPCDQCVSSQSDCQIKGAAQRVSRLIEIQPPEDHESILDEGDTRGLSPKAVPTAPYPPAAADMLKSPISNAQSPTVSLFDQSRPMDSLVSLQQMPEMPDLDQNPALDFSWAGAVPCTTSSWPWLHESIFLQDNPMLNWSNELDSFPMDSTNSFQDFVFPASPNASLPASASHEFPPVETPALLSAQSGFQSPIDQIDTNKQPQERTAAASDSKLQMALQEKVLIELVTYTSDQMVTTASQMSRSFYWQSMSIRIEEAFQLDVCQPDQTRPWLYRMMDAYKDNFSPLWPLLSGREFDPTQLNPMLFLTVVSIGCMYGNGGECSFGSKLHESLRRNLAVSLIGLEDEECDILWLGQARLLTQVAALYFGQRRAFSYAQHLGAILIAQARHMDLFSTLGQPTSAGGTLEQKVDAWHNNECRKRLAFGILRADVFASVLMNTRPILSAEEIQLDLPADDDLWGNLGSIPLEHLVSQLKTEVNHSLGLPFCDIVRVAEDRGESLLNMSPRGYELLLFGLQGHVWRFSHDQAMFERLTGQSDCIAIQDQDMRSPTSERLSISSSAQCDKLGLTYRKMQDLRDDRLRITRTLQRWEQSFSVTRTSQMFAKERTCVMSGMLLLYISYLRLCAPLADLHATAHAMMDTTIDSVDQKKIKRLQEWAKGPGAKDAVENMRHIWLLLHHEINRDSSEKAKYNLLVFSSLHHIAVVLWAIAGTTLHNTDDTPELPGLNELSPIPIQRDHNRPLLRAVVWFYNRLIPRGWYSFAAAAEYMAAHPFPACFPA